jgi:3-methyladenine DNA glycosylase AlkD
MLCSPLRNVNDKRLAEIALANIDRLKHENDILITKAISWVLRTMIKHHKKIVADYLKLNQDILPKIAVRETMTKLKIGTKTKRKNKLASQS